MIRQENINEEKERIYTSFILAVIVIPSSVTFIDNVAFSSNQLALITFPSTALTIYDLSFYNNPITNGGTYAYPPNVTVKK